MVNAAASQQEGPALRVFLNSWERLVCVPCSLVTFSGRIPAFHQMILASLEEAVNRWIDVSTD